jgi:G protein beta subunit-like protein
MGDGRQVDAKVAAQNSVILCTAGYDHTVRFWEAPTGHCYRTLQYPGSQVNRLCITPDKQFLAIAGNPHVHLYQINSSNPNAVTSFDGHTGNVTAVGFQKERKWMYTGSEDGSVKIWDVRAPGYQRDYQSRAAINTVALHPNQGEIISGDEDGNISVWDLTANACSYELVPEGKNAIRSVTIASDGTLVLAANDKGHIFVWKLDRGRFEALHKIEAHDTYCLKALLSPDCKLLATCSSDKTVKLWNVEKNFVLEKVLTGHQKWVWDCSFSADSAYLVTASSDKTAKLWDLSTGEVILDYAGHHKALTSIALNDSST